MRLILWLLWILYTVVPKPPPGHHHAPTTPTLQLSLSCKLIYTRVTLLDKRISTSVPCTCLLITSAPTPQEEFCIPPRSAITRTRLPATTPCRNSQSPMRAEWLVLSATYCFTTICSVSAATIGEPTSTIRQTSTITIVQTVFRATRTAAAATSTASASTDEHSYSDDSVFKNAVLDVSNTVRQNYNASALVWNETLADYAQSWSQGCKFEHSVRCTF